MVGNHSEVKDDQRQVTYSRGKEIALECNAAFIEVSARYNKNVDKAFQLLIAEIERESKDSSEPVASTSCTVQ
jgi:Ras family protein